MNSLTADILPLSRRRFSLRTEWWVLWLLAASSSVVFVEPAPYEILIGIALCVLLVGGARLTVSVLFMFALLMLFNLGGAASLIPVLGDHDATLFIAVSFYLAITSCFFAMLVQEHTAMRLHALKWGFIAGAAFASGAGILGYFNVAGLEAFFTVHGRSSGTFKDPNVLGASVVLAVVFLIQDLMTSDRMRLRVLVVLAVILIGGVFLSFSRGAWGHAFGSLAVMAVLTFLLVANARTRARIIMLSMAGAVALAIALALILSLEEVRTMFELRASLSQSYDIGTTGRFGKQLQSIPELLDRPNGYGPLQFAVIWGEQPHNVYLNAFASYGWLGGLAYLTLVLSTIVIGWQLVLTPGPYQTYAIALWSTLFVMFFAGLLIDSDHWRHFYLLLGLTWGLHALLPRKASNQDWEQDPAPRHGRQRSAHAFR